MKPSERIVDAYTVAETAWLEKIDTSDRLNRVGIYSLLACKSAIDEIMVILDELAERLNKLE